MSLMAKTSFPPREFVGIGEPGQTETGRPADDRRHELGRLRAEFSLAALRFVRS